MYPFIFAFLEIVFLLSVASACRLNGEVYYKVGGPIRNAVVNMHVLQRSVTTDSLGKFSLDIPTGLSHFRGVSQAASGLGTGNAGAEPANTSQLTNNSNASCRPCDTIQVSIGNILYYQSTIRIESDTALKIQLDLLPPMSTELIDSIPDYYQRDTAFGALPGKGAVYCGPVAVSNSLFWFSRHGYPSFISQSGNPHFDHFDLIRQLGSAAYINAGAKGANAEDLCRGLRAYLDKHGINGSVWYEGNYAVSDRFSDGHQAPDLQKIKEFTFNNKAVWLLIGWYSYNPQTNEYHWTGGHWVTLVGYGYDGHRENPQSIVVHDPDLRNITNSYITLEKISDGKIVNDYGKPVGAAGYWRFKTGINYGIINGTVLLSLESPQVLGTPRA